MIRAIPVNIVINSAQNRHINWQMIMENTEEQIENYRILSEKFVREIPNSQKYGFKALLIAQVLGDMQALRERNYPVSRLHFKNRRIGIAQLIEAAKKL